MGNDDPFNDDLDLSNSSHAHFEGVRLNNKDNKNRVRQGGPRIINKTKKWKNETPDNEYVGATPYVSVDTVADVLTMILW